MPKTRYTGVYIDNNGKFFYQVELGIDKITGKRIQKKGRKDQNGHPFSSAREAYKELTRLKNEYLLLDGYSNYDLIETTIHSCAFQHSSPPIPHLKLFGQGFLFCTKKAPKNWVRL